MPVFFLLPSLPALSRKVIYTVKNENPVNSVIRRFLNRRWQTRGHQFIRSEASIQVKERLTVALLALIYSIGTLSGYLPN